MPLFDVYIAVDFSGSKHPAWQRRSIAFAEWDRGLSSDVQNGCFTRADVVSHLLDRIREHNLHGKRVLCGFDFQYSFPQGFWYALTSIPETWTNILQGMANGAAGLPPVVEEPESNARRWAEVANQRIAHLLKTGVSPFWGPNFSQATNPKFLFPHAPFKEFRLVEERIEARNSIFKIGGRGAVGLQSLCGIPHLFHIRNTCSQQDIPLHCWPFEGWDSTALAHVLVEWYPAIQNLGQRSDKEDALACVRWAKIKDDQGELSDFLIPPLSLPEKTRALLEGWILGVL
jgi:hypothetical protein